MWMMKSSSMTRRGGNWYKGLSGVESAEEGPPLMHRRRLERVCSTYGKIRYISTPSQEEPRRWEGWRACSSALPSVPAPTPLVLRPIRKSSITSRFDRCSGGTDCRYLCTEISRIDVSGNPSKLGSCLRSLIATGLLMSLLVAARRAVELAREDESQQS